MTCQYDYLLMVNYLLCCFCTRTVSVHLWYTFSESTLDKYWCSLYLNISQHILRAQCQIIFQVILRNSFFQFIHNVSTDEGWPSVQWAMTMCWSEDADAFMSPKNININELFPKIPPIYPTCSHHQDIQYNNSMHCNPKGKISKLITYTTYIRVMISKCPGRTSRERRVLAPVSPAIQLCGTDADERRLEPPPTVLRCMRTNAVQSIKSEFVVVLFIAMNW